MSSTISETSVQQEPNTSGRRYIKVKAADAYDKEFRYYSKLLRELLIFSDKEDRKHLAPWIARLSSPGYNVHHLRNKRNTITFMICLSLTAGQLATFFKFEPESDMLPHIRDIGRMDVYEFDCDEDKTWEEELGAYLDDRIEKDLQDITIPDNIKCSLHPRLGCPKPKFFETNNGNLLDKQFRFLLHLVKPYAAALVRHSDRVRVAKWIQTLCSIDDTYCLFTKGIRNDYMTVLAGHIPNQDLVGPFEDYPLDTLLPLEEFAKLRSEKKPITDPTSPATAEFFLDTPNPDEGAFAFIAVTGDLYMPKHHA